MMSSATRFRPRPMRVVYARFVYSVAAPIAIVRYAPQVLPPSRLKRILITGSVVVASPTPNAAMIYSREINSGMLSS